MEIYVLDIAFRRSELIDEYFSFLWTERFHDLGEFILEVPVNQRNAAILTPGEKLAHTDSSRVMFIESLEKRKKDGQDMLIAKGRSYEKILDDRVLAHPEEPKWEYTAPPAAVARQMFDDICVDFILTKEGDEDTIEFLGPGNIYPADTIEEPRDNITVSLPPMSLLKAIRDVCVEHRLGFRITRAGDTKKLHFNIYSGSDRTPQGNKAFPVTFSEGLNNLQNISSLATNAVEKNVIWVVSQFGDREILVKDGNGGIGESRKQLVINAEGITEEMTPEERTLTMIQQGNEAMALCRPITAFDGQADPNGNYKYDRDYYLGDLVGIESSVGGLNYMRVTEQIFVSDQNGYRTYPTLSVDTQANPGSWLAWGGHKEWDDLTTEQWGTMI